MLEGGWVDQGEGPEGGGGGGEREGFTGGNAPPPQKKQHKKKTTNKLERCSPSNTMEILGAKDKTCSNFHILVFFKNVTLIMM